jgi:protein SCO1/2
VKSEKLKTKDLRVARRGRSFCRAVCFSLLVFSFSLLPASAQKNEHYNSPLYSPRYYDPSVDTSNGMPPALKDVGIEPRMGEQLPLDTEFKDENGNIVKLGSFFTSGRPVIVAFVYYECPMLCNQVLNGLTGSLKGMSFDAGKQFDVVAISFDAREFDKPGLAANKKASYMERYGRPGTEKGWHFLTGTQASIDAVTRAAGFNYKWDERSDQFAHAAAIMVTTPDAKLAKYFYGIDYSPKDLKFGLMESAESKVGNAAEKLLLYCYHYDPATGKYGLAILRVLRAAGVLTLLGMGGMAFIFWRRNKRRVGADH